jgi:hypothetical protein
MILLTLTIISSFLINYISSRDYGFLLSFFFHWLLFHAVTIGVDRFHLPLLPISAIFAGFAILAFWTKYMGNKKKGKPISTVLNRILKLIGQALLLWGILLISFGGYFLLLGVLNLDTPSQEDLETLSGLVVITLIIAMALPVGYFLRQDLEIKSFERL